MRVNRGEEIDEDEEAKAREVAEAKAKKELADAVRLAAELRVQNQTSLTELARNWAVKLFDTSRMSGPEFEEWKAEGLDLFGDVGGEAADRAREVVTKPKDGYVTVKDDGKIIARHRGDEFVFTAGTTLPWVKSVSEVEFADLPDAIEADPGDTGFGTGDDPGDDDPSGFLEGMSRTAQSGGSISPSNIPTEAEARQKFIKRAERVKLSTATRAALGSKTDSIAGVLATTDRQIKRGVDVKVGKVAKPFELFSPDNNVPTDPAPPVPQAGTAPTGPTLSGPEPDPAGDHAKPKPWYAPGPVHERKMAALEVEVSIRGTELAIVDFQELLIGKHGENIPNIAGAAATLIEARKILGELGVKGKFYAKELNGKIYVIIRGRAGMRKLLTGTRYLASDPKIIAFGIGAVPWTLSTVRVGLVVITADVAVETMNAIISDETDMADYLGKVGPSVAKAAVATVAGHVLAGLAIVTIAPLGGIVATGIFFSIAIGVVLDMAFGEEEEKQLAEKIRAYLQKNEELTRLYLSKGPREGEDGTTVP